MDRIKSLGILIVLVIVVGVALKQFRQKSLKSNGKDSISINDKDAALNAKSVKKLKDFKVPSMAEIVSKHSEVKCKTEEEQKLCARFKNFKDNPEFGVVIRGTMVLIMAPAMNDFRIVLNDHLNITDEDLQKMSMEDRKKILPSAIGTFVAWWVFNRMNPLGLKNDEFEDKTFVISITGNHPVRGYGQLVKATASAETIISFLPTLYKEGAIDRHATMKPDQPGSIYETFVIQ